MIHKTTRSILSVLLAVLLLVTSVPLTPAFADGGAVSPQSESDEGRALEGSGTESDPYQIGSAEELRDFAKLVNEDGKTTANAILTDDIDLNPGFTFKEDGRYSGPDGEEPHQWTPIGTSIGNAYTGTFDGNGHTISGLYINDSTADDQGLFGYVGGYVGTGTVKDLTVSGSVKGDSYVGGVVGNNLGTVINCAFSGSVSGSNHVGGVVGYNSGPVKNCYNTGSVNGSIEAGGVVGYNGDNVENCYNTGTVTGSAASSNVGGVVGGTTVAPSKTATTPAPLAAPISATVTGSAASWGITAATSQTATTPAPSPAPRAATTTGSAALWGITAASWG